MGKAVRLSVWTVKELIRLNRVRKFKKLYDLGDATRADGITVSPGVLDASAGTSTWQFPLERPTQADFNLCTEHSCQPEQWGAVLNNWEGLHAYKGPLDP